MPAANLENSGDVSAIHGAVAEAVESYFYALDTIRPTASNLCGDPGSNTAFKTLTRLAHALVPFPRRRLDPDPFFLVNKNTIRLPLGSEAVHGTSLHDVWLRFIGRAYDAMRIIPTYAFTDPHTGRGVKGVRYVDGIKCSDATSSDDGERQYLLTPEHFHFSELPWDDALWHKVKAIIIEQSVAFHERLPVAPYRTLDQIHPYLNAEFAFALRNAPTASAVPTKDAKDLPAQPVGKKTKGKNIEARMLKVLSDNPLCLNWTSQQWAEHLDCSEGMIRGCAIWRDHIPKLRAGAQLERLERCSARSSHERQHQKY